MNRDRRTRTLRACRPRQGARRVGGAWTVDDRWKGIATVPRSVAADSLLDPGVLFGTAAEPTEPRILFRGEQEPAEEPAEGEAG
ncbi:hypothetical protein [Nocardia altamirensis]|uniref:hypothetical protein n=1 Tax=Nocardia altamirensis TaxID=472158 RepID=UPI00084011B5|nr:hypothetical protein [Nocardia altamirensis]